MREIQPSGGTRCHRKDKRFHRASQQKPIGEIRGANQGKICGFHKRPAPQPRKYHNGPHLQNLIPTSGKRHTARLRTPIKRRAHLPGNGIENGADSQYVQGRASVHYDGRSFRRIRRGKPQQSQSHGARTLSTNPDYIPLLPPKPRNLRT